MGPTKTMHAPPSPFLTRMLGLGLGLTALAQAACDPADVPGPCSLACNEEAYLSGQATISGIPSIDAFFGAALDVDTTMRGLSGELRAELDAIGASVGLAPGATGAELSAALDAHLMIYVDGGLSVEYAPPQCQASVEASLAAAAECDAEVDPGELTASCSGSCAAEAGVAVDCGAEATLMCEGTAPGLACDGTCSGECSASIDGVCEGSCRGSCDGMDGFQGSCGGTCSGECITDLSVGGTCSGRCEGTCSYVAPEGGCEANATARCEAMAGASIECEAGCEGTVEPPEVSAECEATVDAKANASLQCTPPTLRFDYQLHASIAGDAMARAEFRAWLQGFRGHLAAIVALRAEAEVLGDAAASLSLAATGAVQGALDDLSAGVDVAAIAGAGCAIPQLADVIEGLLASSGALVGEVEASVEVLASVGG